MMKKKLISILIAVFLVFVLSRGVSLGGVVYFKVGLPKSGSVWIPGNWYTIQWDTQVTPYSGGQFPWVWVKLLLYPQGQLNKATVIGEFPINENSYSLGWQVPPNIAVGSYVIRVQSRDEMTYYEDQKIYTNTYGESGVFTIVHPTQGVILPGQPGFVPPYPDMFTGPITPAPASPSGTEKRDISGAKSYTAADKKKDISGAKSYSASAGQKSSSTVATAPKIPNVSGQWKSSNGLVYDIKQTGDRFEWTVKDKNEKADGVIKGNNISATWQRDLKSGSIEGKITAIDSTGKATRIDWNNGMRFYR